VEKGHEVSSERFHKNSISESRYRMHVPFTYRPVYCAERGDDIPSDWRLTRNGSHSRQTQKLFLHMLQPRVPDANPIETRVSRLFAENGFYSDCALALPSFRSNLSP
jgi:hypothetical protein